MATQQNDLVSATALPDDATIKKLLAQEARMRVELLELQLGDAKKAKQKENDELEQARSVREQGRSIEKKKAEALKYRQEKVCRHIHDLDHRNMSMVDGVFHLDGSLTCTCAMCGKQWEGPAGKLRQELGTLFPSDQKIGGAQIGA